MVRAVSVSCVISIIFAGCAENKPKASLDSDEVSNKEKEVSTSSTAVDRELEEKVRLEEIQWECLKRDVGELLTEAPDFQKGSVPNIAKQASGCLQELSDPKYSAVTQSTILSNILKELAEIWPHELDEISEKPTWEKPEYKGAVRINGRLKGRYNGGFLERDGLIVVQKGKYIVILGAEVQHKTLWSMLSDRIAGFATPTGKTIVLDLGDGREAKVFEIANKEDYQDHQKKYKDEVAAAREEFKNSLENYRQLVKRRKEETKQRSKNEKLFRAKTDVLREEVSKIPGFENL
jgi:hypothetical protein